MTLGELIEQLQDLAPDGVTVNHAAGTEGVTFSLAVDDTPENPTIQWDSAIFLPLLTIREMGRPELEEFANAFFLAVKTKTKAPVMTEEEMEAELGAANGTRRRSKK